MNILVELIKYLMLVLIGMYAFYCLGAIRCKNKKQLDRYHAVLVFIIFFLHFAGNAALYIQVKSTKLLYLYGGELLLFVLVLVLYRLIYPKLSKLLIRNMLMLLAVSFIMLARLSIDMATRQMLIVAGAFVISLFIPMITRYLNLLQSFGWFFGLAGVLLLVIVLFAGTTNFGATNWLSILGFSFQPSEIVKVMFVLSMASLLRIKAGLKQICIVTGLAAAHVLILVLQKDLGGALIFFFTYVFILYAATMQPLLFLGGLLAGSGAAYVAYQLFSHVRVRVLAWYNPFAYIDKEGYQIAQSLFAIGCGGWFGMGINKGKPAEIPVVDSDFIFSAISEEFGGLFVVCIILIYLSCFIIFMDLALKQEEPFWRLAVSGFAVMFIFQIFLSIGGVIKFIPSTGVTLPLISRGGSSAFATIVMFMIIQGIYMRDKSQAQHERLSAEGEPSVPDEAFAAYLNSSLDKAHVGGVGNSTDRFDSPESHQVKGLGKKLRKNKSKRKDYALSDIADDEARGSLEKGSGISLDKTTAGSSNKDSAISKKKYKRPIYNISFVFLGLFVLILGYYSYFLLFKSKEVIDNPYNRRQEVLAGRIIRGQILSADKKVLARTIVDEEGNESREYPYGELFAHLVGRTKRGITGLEQTENIRLLTSSINSIKQMYLDLQGEKSPGDNIITTLDTGLQQLAFDALGSRRGAIVVMEPDTGKILAMVSKPSYDPNQIDEIWDELVNDEENQSPLINRATQGLYPPGSTFKLLTALEFMRENPEYKSYRYDCRGRIEFGSMTINCYEGKKHGLLELPLAFAKSCNTSFANIGKNLDMDSFYELCSQFYFNKALPVEMAQSISNFSLKKGNSGTKEAMQTAIGQGNTLLTPLHNAMIVSTIANGGLMMKPYVIDRIESADGGRVKKYSPQQLSMPVTPAEAAYLGIMMRRVVTDGTAKRLMKLDLAAAGKTGSADHASNQPAHAWFIGYAPYDDPKIAVSILVESVGTGSDYAVPIAEEIFKYYFDREQLNGN